MCYRGKLYSWIWCVPLCWPFYRDGVLHYPVVGSSHICSSCSWGYGAMAGMASTGEWASPLDMALPCAPRCVQCVADSVSSCCKRAEATKTAERSRGYDFIQVWPFWKASVLQSTQLLSSTLQESTLSVGWWIWWRPTNFFLVLADLYTMLIRQAYLLVFSKQ